MLVQTMIDSRHLIRFIVVAGAMSLVKCRGQHAAPTATVSSVSNVTVPASAPTVVAASSAAPPAMALAASDGSVPSTRASAEPSPATSSRKRGAARLRSTTDSDCYRKCERRNMYTDCADDEGHMMPCPCHCP